MTEYEFYLCLRTRFAAKEYALLPQVRNGTGFKKKARTADAIAVSLWPSRGIDVHGFEFKDSRSDWLKELDEPEKADEIGKHCAFWWVVVSDKVIVKDSELPKQWGLMLATDKIKILKDAPRREAQAPDWLFTAAVLRAAVEVVTDEVAIQKRIDKAKWDAQAAERISQEAKFERLKKTHKDEIDGLMEKIREFEESSGLKLDTWRNSFGRNRELGEAVRFVMQGGLKEELKRFDRALVHFAELQKVASKIRDAAQFSSESQS